MNLMEVKKVDFFKRQLAKNAQIVETALETYLPKQEEYPEVIHKSMRYSTFAGGKRIRPIMVLEAAKLFGLPYEKAMPTACGIEMIHTYSLIHDDLPCMDNDDFRRGKPTCHKAFNEAIALLAGDALLTQAFLVIAKNASIEGISKSAVLDVIENTAYAVGSCGMVGGQTVDIESAGKTVDKQTMLYIISHKTGCLIKASLWAGARLAEASKSNLDIIEEYGEKMGLIFQLVDDMLNIKGDEKLLGKPVGSDLKNNKNTFPNIYGYDYCVKTIEKLSIEAKELMCKYENKEFFINLVDFFVKRNY